MKKLKVLVACEESQRVCNAFRKLGHEAYSCDLVDCSGGFPEYHIKQDVKPLLNGFCEFKTCDGKLHKIRNKWDLIIAHPPCTWFSNATMVNLGRKDHPEVFNEEWRKNFYKKQRQAFEFFLSIWNCNCDHIAIENVIGWLNTNFRKPTQIIQPYYFGEPYRKATCLWLYNLPKLEPTDVVEPTCKWVKHNLKAKNDLVGYEKKGVYGSKNRSTTFVGIAEAMATQWSEFITNARSKERECSAYAYAKTYYNLGYRKIPEGSVVLTKEELNDLEYKAYSRGVCFACEKVEEQKEKARKETAKEILQELWYSKLETTIEVSSKHNKEDIKIACQAVVDLIRDKIQELAKKFGVEVEE